MPHGRPKNGETLEEARIRYNAEQREYRAMRKALGNPLVSSKYNYEAWRESYCLHRYGITLSTAQSMLDTQGGGCAICRTPLRLDNRDATVHSAIDHCHTTGKVRGVLCMHCNQGLGKFKDSPELLYSAISYLLP